MIRSLCIMATCVALSMATGCAHMEKIADANKANYSSYAVQQRDMKTVEMEFSSGMGQQGGSITVTGLTKLTLSVPLTPLASPTAERGIVGPVMDGAGKLAPFAMGTYLGGKALDNTSGGASKINNNGAITGNVTQ